MDDLGVGIKRRRRRGSPLGVRAAGPEGEQPIILYKADSRERSGALELQITNLVPSSGYRLEVHRVGYHANDAYSAYIEMGSPKELTTAQNAHLDELIRNLPETEMAIRSGSDGTLEFSIPMNSNDVVLVKVALSGANK